MKHRLSILLLLITISAFSQNHEFYDISWKVNNNDSIFYDVILGSIKPESISLNKDSLLHIMQSEEFELSEEFYNQIQLDYGGYPIKLMLKGNGNQIHVLGTNNDDFDFSTNTNLYSTSPLLNQFVTNNGENLSFWMEPRRAGITELLLKLPNKPVRINDHWSVSTNYTRIYYPESFVRDSSYRVNQIELTSIDIIENEVFAEYEYHIEEYVNGTYNTDPKSVKRTGQGQTASLFLYRAKCYFNVTRGRIENLFGVQIQKLDTNEQDQFAIVKYELKLRKE